MPNGNRLLELRKAAGMEQAAVAELLGVHQSMASRYERGEVGIPDEHKLTLAAHFGCTVSWLMGWSDMPNNGEPVAA